MTAANAIERRPAVAAYDLTRPYQVRMDERTKGRFDDLRDAISSARIAKTDRPLSRIVVVDNSTGQLIVEIE